MAKGRINLEEIFNNNFDCYSEFDSTPNISEEPAMTKSKFKKICLEFGKQLLELASENASVKILSNEVNKESILNTIDQVELNLPQSNES